jgi:hypothetical protein
MPHKKAIAFTFDMLLNSHTLDGDMCNYDGETKAEREYIDARCKLIVQIRNALKELRERALAGEFD